MVFYFFISIILGSLLSDYILISLKSTLFYLRFLIFIFAIYYILNNSENFLKFLKNILLITFVILILE